MNINQELFQQLVKDAITHCEDKLYKLYDKEDNDYTYDFDEIVCTQLQIKEYRKLLSN